MHLLHGGACDPFEQPRRGGRAWARGNGLHSLSARPKLYAGRMKRVDLDEDLMDRKRALLFHYASQLPLLFGSRPADLLREHRASFSTEVAMEISVKRSFAHS